MIKKLFILIGLIIVSCNDKKGGQPEKPISDPQEIPLPTFPLVGDFIFNTKYDELRHKGITRNFEYKNTNFNIQYVPVIRDGLIKEVTGYPKTSEGELINWLELNAFFLDSKKYLYCNGDKPNTILPLPGSERLEEVRELHTRLINLKDYVLQLRLDIEPGFKKSSEAYTLLDLGNAMRFEQHYLSPDGNVLVKITTELPSPNKIKTKKIGAFRIDYLAFDDWKTKILQEIQMTSWYISHIQEEFGP